MKLKALVALVALALAGASLAYAAPKAVGKKPPTTTNGTTTHGKKPPKQGPGCKPMVAVILRGTLDGIASDKSSLSLHVTGGNHFGKVYKGTDPTVLIVGSTKINRRGHHSLDAFVGGDRLLVHARACKADFANGGEPSSLTARRVTAQPATS